MFFTIQTFLPIILTLHCILLGFHITFTSLFKQNFPKIVNRIFPNLNFSHLKLPFYYYTLTFRSPLLFLFTLSPKTPLSYSSHSPVLPSIPPPALTPTRLTNTSRLSATRVVYCHRPYTLLMKRSGVAAQVVIRFLIRKSYFEGRCVSHSPGKHRLQITLQLWDNA